MNIYLIGLMGSGKSHIGKLLAQKLNYRFLDLDDAIEKSENKSIAEIFETDGEIEFRKLEAVQLQKTGELKNTVISCGGGTPCFHENIKWINDNGFSVFLNPSLNCIIERLKNETEKRPILKGKDNEELLKIITELFTNRLSFYQQAILKIESENELEILNKILSFIV
jgi:shikimate kinase